MKAPNNGSLPVERVLAIFRSELEAVRKDIAAAQEERHEITGAPVSVGEAIVRLNEWIEALRREFVRTIHPRRFLAPVYRAPSLSEAPNVVMLALLDAVKEKLAQEISALHLETPGIDSKERDKRLADNASRAIDLEIKEEAIIRAAEASGFDVIRRADADPRAVLAAFPMRSAFDLVEDASK